MAGTVDYLYDPNQEVYVIRSIGCTRPVDDTILSVERGTVVRIRAEVLLSEQKLRYDIRLEGQSGTEEFEEDDVFADKASAVTEYQTRLP